MTDGWEGYRWRLLYGRGEIRYTHRSNSRAHPACYFWPYAKGPIRSYEILSKSNVYLAYCIILHNREEYIHEGASEWNTSEFLEIYIGYSKVIVFSRKCLFYRNHIFQYRIQTEPLHIYWIIAELLKNNYFTEFGMNLLVMRARNFS